MNYRINDFFSAGVFLCISSGDLEPGQGTFTEYFAPVPYHFRAPVFFEGLGTLGDPETLSLIGVFKPGVIAPGIKLSFEKNDNILIHLNITCIYPEKTETGGNTTLYGVETDLSIQYKITNSLEFTTDAGYLVYDTYFENNGKIPDPAGKFGIKLFFMF